MPGDDVDLVAEQLRRVFRDRYVVGVRDVIALLLQPLDQVEVGADEAVANARVVHRPLEGDLDGARGPGHGVLATGGVVVERLAAPVVVGLIRRPRDDEEDV
jgi:hypothetical protein